MIRNLKALSFLIFVLLTSSAYGQFGELCVDCYPSVEVGGVNSSINGFDNTSSKTGFYIGYFNYRWISDSFALRAGTTYQNLGVQIDDAEDNFIIHSINFPISLHYTYQNKFQGFIGGELGTNLFGSYPESNESSTIIGANDVDIREVVSFLDASIFFGVGVIISDNIDINLRYNLGVTDVRSQEFNTEGEEWKENWLTLSLAYTWRD